MKQPDAPQGRHACSDRSSPSGWGTCPRALCQSLLNGSPDAAVLEAARSFVVSALATVTGNDVDPSDFGMAWAPSTLPHPDDTAARHTALQALAPTLLLDGIWLAQVAQPATAHRPAEAHLFDLYGRIVGLNDPACSPPLRFRADLLKSGVYLPAVDSPDFFDHPAFPDWALSFPGLHLCLLHHPRPFFPELLGYTLAHVHREPAWWDDDSANETSIHKATRRLALAALAEYPDRQAQDTRIRAGWQLYRQGFERLLKDIAGQLARPATVDERMAELVRARCSHALGYHGQVMLEGRSLDAWFAEARDDPRPLLETLRRSSYVDHARPAGSLLIRAMDFGGPMFGVFDEAERQLWLEWIEGPEQVAYSGRENAQSAGGFSRSTTYSQSARGLYGQAGVDTPARRNGGMETPHRVKLPLPPGEGRGEGINRNVPRIPSNRALYTTLLHTESPAECPPAAEAMARRILRRSHWLSILQPGRRPFPYGPERFRHHIETRNRREVDRYRPLSGEPRISRDFCRWAALQLAPAILVDGAWLAGVPTAAEKLGESGRHLLKIYADELGNGRIEQNHPNVYRRLLDSLELDLPAFDSAEFAQSPRFLDTAFDIPVYLLAMGQLADRYFPELLGLNLAIELSGLGASYRQVLDLLRHHGIDPAIIQLHLSIDNPASGHTARARDAILIHLDGVRRHQGPEAVEREWRRIWDGYGSLGVAAFPLAVGFLKRHLRERAGHRLRMAAGVFWAGRSG